MDELKRMQQMMKENEELQKKFVDEIKAAVEGGAKSDGEAMSIAAKALGFNISASDWEKAKAQELSDEELDHVTGGEGLDPDVLDFFSREFKYLEEDPDYICTNFVVFSWW
ncbi:MAG: Nif11-like leader peptide family RiPP precursor [bacterium]|nr:Nif11-like leader peptide family RiPP precursor [bacterium]